MDAAGEFDAEVRARVAARTEQDLAFADGLDSGRTLVLSINEHRPSGRFSSGGGVTIRDNTIPAIGSFGQRVAVGERTLVSISGLVHDGVDTVRLVDKSGADRARPVVTEVSDNVFHVLVTRRMGPRMTVQWRAPNGRIVGRVASRTR